MSFFHERNVILTNRSVRISAVSWELHVSTHRLLTTDFPFLLLISDPLRLNLISQKIIFSDNVLTVVQVAYASPLRRLFTRTRFTMGSFVIRTYQKSLRHLFIECVIHVQHYCGRNTILFS